MRSEGVESSYNIPFQAEIIFKMRNVWMKNVYDPEKHDQELHTWREEEHQQRGGNRGRGKDAQL